MQYRKDVLATSEIYHVYNRSIAKELLFSSLRSLHHFSKTIEYYRFPQRLRLSHYDKLPKDGKDAYALWYKSQLPLVEVYAFSFMPNHYHLLVKQLQETGITMFISAIQDSFAKYYNVYNTRNGGLFQSPFQAKWVETDEIFMHISRYIHLNHVTDYIVTFKQLCTYPYSSFADYVGEQCTEWVKTQFILDSFGSRLAYKEFVEDQVGFQRSLAEMKDIAIDYRDV